MPTVNNPLLKACQDENWFEADRLIADGARIDLKHLGWKSLYAVYPKAVGKPSYTHLAKEIERVLPNVGTDRLEEAVEDGDIDTVGVLLDAAVPSTLETMTRAPAHCRLAAVNLYLEKRKLRRSEADDNLGLVSGACFDRLLAADADFDRAILAAAGKRQGNVVTDLLNQGWDRKLVKESLPYKLLNEWAHSPSDPSSSAPPPAAIRAKLKALQRMASINLSACSKDILESLATAPHDILNVRLIDEIHRNNLSAVNALLKLGAALDGEVAGHEPIRIAAASGQYHAFNALVAAIHDADALDNQWVETIARTAYNASYRGGDEKLRIYNRRWMMASCWMALFQGKPAHQRVVDTLLYQAVLHNEIAHVKELVLDGANPHANGGAAFDTASLAGNPTREAIGKILAPPVPWEAFNHPDRARRWRNWWNVCERSNAAEEFKALLAPTPAPANATARRRPG